ncbi:MAG: hypothetical protein E3J72_13190 [Planctomycetota bacterium]|nr:MAG: hypothetical protein E3J72_13190 [Planctomycetota bacterium]
MDNQEFKYVAGVDEAGYGPWLGPLVISASVFKISEPPENFWTRLSSAVHARIRGAGDKVVVADSKKLYNRKKGLRTLEETVWSFLHLLHGDKINSLEDYIKHLSCGQVSGCDRYPWYDPNSTKLPRVAFTNMTHKKSRALSECMVEAGIEFSGVWSERLHAGEFNRILEDTDNKSLVEWRAVSYMLLHLAKTFGRDGLLIIVDRLGGRRRYGRQLFETFGSVRFGKDNAAKLKIVEQKKKRSEYELKGAAGGIVRIVFEEKADRNHFPVALASCFSKYLRELFVESLNNYFTKHDPKLKPTAGYVKDARRWLADTKELRQRLGVNRVLLVRAR